MAMYLEHFGLTEAPFKITPHTEFFFAGANRGETLDALMFAITSGEGMVKVTGEVGSGKTMLCRVLMERLPAEVETIYLAVPSISRDEILGTIASDLGIKPSNSTTKIIRALQTRLIELHAAGRQVVALIDEAHAMPLETLEEIRLLSNLETGRDKLMQIVVFGQPELDAHLMLPNMRQLRERITHSFNLQPLPAREIREYLNFRLRAAGYKGPDLFAADAVKLIAEASEGLTRRINIYADKTLLAAYAQGTHNVTVNHVRAAIADTRIILEPAATQSFWKPAALAAAIGLAVGIALGWFAARNFVPAAATTAVAPARPEASAPTGSESGRVAAEKLPKETRADGAAALPPKAEPSAGQVPVVPAKYPEDAAAIAVAPVTSAVAGGRSSLAAQVPRGDSNRPADAETAPRIVAAKAGSGWLDERISQDVSRLSKLDAQAHFVQLLSAEGNDRDAIADFVRVASRLVDEERLLLVPVGTAESPRVNVLFGPFDGYSEAAAELPRVPARLTSFRPYVRSIQEIRARTRTSA